jgi:hypothetical protein
VTAISLLSIKVDSPPEQLRLDLDHGGPLLRLEAGVHLDLTRTSPATCQELARLIAQAGRVNAARHYVDRITEVA